MEEKYIIELLKKNQWHALPNIEHITLQDASHECLLMIPQLKRHSDGVRIIHEERDLDSNNITRTVVFEKMLLPINSSKAAHNKKSIRNEHSIILYLYKNILTVSLSIIAALITVAYISYYIINSERSVILPKSTVRNSYISRVDIPDSLKDDKYRAMQTNYMSNDMMKRFLKTNPTLIEQSNDVVSLFNGLSYMNCGQKKTIRENLSEEFRNYVRRSKSAEIDKLAAINNLEINSNNEDVELTGRDIVFRNIGCGGLYAMYEIYQKWFHEKR